MKSLPGRLKQFRKKFTENTSPGSIQRTYVRNF